MRGKLKFVDVAGVSSVITLNGLDDADPNALTKLSSFSTALRAYTNAAITEYGVAIPNIQEVLNEGTASTAYSSTMHKGIVRFSYIENNEKKNVALYIPAPNVAGFNLLDEVGYRVQDGWGNAIRDALRTATGIAGLNLESGVLEYIDGKSSRPSSGAYILFQDDNERFQYMGVPGVTDLAKLAAFSAALFEGSSVYTNAAVREYGIITPQSLTRSDTADTEDGYDSVEGRAIMKFGFIEGLYDKKYMSMTLPAAKQAVFVSTSNKTGVPVTRATGEAIAAALTTLYGSGVRFLKYQSGKRDIVTLNG